ncbi:unnamed protein product [Allacma fusca]|uniref:Uncharacterized protein n=1 Tax=Allacma fusca TaxID=39272 RepID=A0A8J2PNK0_9HEXA|nr:unnamed protein product [Allacma fusca]
MRFLQSSIRFAFNKKSTIMRALVAVFLLVSILVICCEAQLLGRYYGGQQNQGYGDRREYRPVNPRLNPYRPHHPPPFYYDD